MLTNLVQLHYRVHKSIFKIHYGLFSALDRDWGCLILRIFTEKEFIHVAWIQTGRR